jgi:hypothetical protein
MNHDPLYDINEVPHVRLTKVDHKLMRLSMIQPKLPLSVCIKRIPLARQG